MIEHKKCRPPRGVIVKRVLDGARVLKKDAGKPGHAFLTEDPIDNTTATIWIVDCECRGDSTCPRAKMLDVAAGLYDSVSVKHRAAFSAARARGIKR